VQVAAEDKIKAELRHCVLVPITKPFFKIVFWSVKLYSQSRGSFRKICSLCKTDLAPSDFYHLAHLRKHPADKRFATGVNVKEAVPLGADTLHRLLYGGTNA
jgi:hypothetical protein